MFIEVMIVVHIKKTFSNIWTYKLEACTGVYAITRRGPFSQYKYILTVSQISSISVESEEINAVKIMKV